MRDFRPHRVGACSSAARLPALVPDTHAQERLSDADRLVEAGCYDCETGFYLGLVLADQRPWPMAADVLVSTVQCLNSVELRLVEEIGELRTSSDPPARQELQIARPRDPLALEVSCDQPTTNN